MLYLTEGTIHTIGQAWQTPGGETHGLELVLTRDTSGEFGERVNPQLSFRCYNTRADMVRCFRVGERVYIRFSVNSHFSEKFARYYTSAVLYSISHEDPRVNASAGLPPAPPTPSTAQPITMPTAADA